MNNAARPTLTPRSEIVPDLVRSSGGVVEVTIGIPCYNRPGLLEEALASIAAQRDFDAYEVVICDDGNLPETRAVVERCAVKDLRFYVNRPNLGPVQNWNHCIELASAPWVTILHEDDLLYPWLLAMVAPRLRPSVSAVAVRCAQGATPPRHLQPPAATTPQPYPAVWFLKGAMTPFPGVFFRRDVALEIGGFDVRRAGLADYAFWYELARRGPVETFRETAAFYRVNEGQWTERAWPDMLRKAHILRLQVARQELPHHPRLGRWIARFYTARMARSYRTRFSERPATLLRAERFERMWLSRVPSGWVWALLRQIGKRDRKFVG